MCSTAVLGVMAGGTVMQAGGQIASGLQNQSIAEYNAKVSELQARDAIRRGEEAEHRHRVDVRRLIGAQRASFAGQGVDVNDGSAAEVQADAQAMGELDALTIRDNAMMEAWGHRAQAQNAKMQGRLAMMQGITGAAGTLLVGGAQMYSMHSYLNPPAGRMSGSFSAGNMRFA